MRKIIITVCLFFIVFQLYTQTNIELLKRHVYILASDSFLGRKPYTKGDTLAVNYIINEYKNNKVRLYKEFGKQEISFLHKKDIQIAELSINQFNYQYKRDFVPSYYSKNVNTEAQTAFVGYGMSVKVKDTVYYDYYHQGDVKGKWVISLVGKPELLNLPRSYYSEHAKATIAKRKGAVGIIFVLKNNELPEQNYYSLNEGIFPIIFITNDVFNELCIQEKHDPIALKQKADSQYFFTPIQFNSKIKANVEIQFLRGYSNNIIGITEGSDPILKNEYVVVGAHFDHLGDKYFYQNNQYAIKVFNGADDNASGVAGIIELMRIIEALPSKPKRSIIWVAFAAEEMGLIGSKAFVENPPVPLNQIKAMINLDMIGRMDDVDPKLTLSGTGSSKVFNNWLKKNKSKFPFTIVENPYGEGPSDHANFYRKNIPVLFLNSGLHEDYHQPTDDADKINFTRMAQIVDFTYILLSDIANYPKKITFSETKLKNATKKHKEVRISLGIIPDVSSSSDGLKVEGVREGSIADKGGLKKGDIIVSMNGKAVKNIYDYMDRLNELENERQVKVKIKRNQELKELSIRLL